MSAKVRRPNLLQQPGEWRVCSFSGVSGDQVMFEKQRLAGTRLIRSPSPTPRRFVIDQSAAMLAAKMPENLANVCYHIPLALAAAWRAVIDETFARGCRRDYHDANALA